MLQWGALVLSAVFALLFLLVQSQTANFRYGVETVPPVSLDDDAEAEPAAPDLPSVAQIDALRAESRVVTLPGAIAGFDRAEVDRALAAVTGFVNTDDDTVDPGVLLVPPDTTREQRTVLRDAERLDVKVYGMQVSGDRGTPAAEDLTSWQNVLVSGDVTDTLVGAIQLLGEQTFESAIPRVPWREPTSAELATVSAALDSDRRYLAPGSTVTELPATAAAAFPDTAPLLVVLPRASYGESVPEYGPALAARYPDTPVVVMYGYWIDVHGPGDDGLELVRAAFYGATPSDFADGGYRQSGVLGLFLQRWAEFNYSGMFDRPLPYTPPDPVRVAWPILPWIFAAGVLFFVVMSVRMTLQLRPMAADQRPNRHTLAGLSTLAVELSGLVGPDQRTDFTQGTVALTHAQDGLDADLPADRVAAVLDEAASALDSVARSLDRPDYRPERFLDRRDRE